MDLRTLTAGDAEYPSRLAAIEGAPSSLRVRGSLGSAPAIVAIVGTREPWEEARAFARDLAEGCARAGAVVVSGGARGIDAAAHRGALDGGGRTWVVCGTPPDRCYPAEHEALFDEVVARGGAMIWPFETMSTRGSFHARNRVLVAIADAVVVVQAPAPSGTLNAAKHARELGRPIWAVAVAPWAGFVEDAETGARVDAWAGSRHVVDEGAKVLTTVPRFLRALGLTTRTGDAARPPRALAGEQLALFEATSTAPRHVDEIAMRARICGSAASAGLLTLALENVLVEGPEGFYRRGS